MSRILNLLACTSIGLLLGLTSAHAHEGDDPGRGGRVLGEINFPTTTESKAAQNAFIQGMLLLHLFEYEFAEERFQRAQELDPGFAMAYWGEAMTHNHPIWDEQERDKARAILARLGSSAEDRQSRTSSQKEKDWLAALDVLYGQGPKAARDLAYMEHMRRMAETYPDDHEVQLFYSLALMGTGAGVRDIPTYMESAARAQSVFYQNRQHPGAAHYLIHSVDDPIHAPLGLEAAHALSEMAPDAGHSLHMTTHIFVAVGMWDEVVQSNFDAVRVQNGMRVIQGQPTRNWGHYNYWMLYGLLQQGRSDDARQLLQTARDEAIEAGAVPDNPLELDADRSHIGSLVQMWARYMIETRGGDEEVAGWTFNMGEAYDPQLNFHFVRSLYTANRGDAVAARQHLDKFQALVASLRETILAMERQAPTHLLYLDRLGVMEQEMLALIAWADEDPETAVRHAAEASRLEGEMPYSFGPPFVDLPSAEMLGGFLLSLERWDEAADAFELQLQRTRMKRIPMEGLAQAKARKVAQN